MSLLSDVVFTSPKGFIVFPKHLLEKMEQYKQDSHLMPESGGTILGSIRGLHLEITDITLPQPEDGKSRFRFARRALHHFKSAVDRWNNSCGTESYLGEWHTHPQRIAAPSSIDIAEWQRKLPKRRMFLVIIGMEKHWFGYWDGNKLVAIQRSERKPV